MTWTYLGCCLVACHRSKLLYSIFLAPSLWYLFDELLDTNKAHRPDVIPMSPSAVGLLGFGATVFGLYGALRFALE